MVAMWYSQIALQVARRKGRQGCGREAARGLGHEKEAEKNRAKTVHRMATM
jgi:hypothetical protein